MCKWSHMPPVWDNTWDVLAHLLTFKKVLTASPTQSICEKNKSTFQCKNTFDCRRKIITTNIIIIMFNDVDILKYQKWANMPCCSLLYFIIITNRPYCSRACGITYTYLQKSASIRSELSPRLWIANQKYKSLEKCSCA